MTAPPRKSDEERRRRQDRATVLYVQLHDLDHGPLLADHPPAWTGHPVPYCAGDCAGGETWPCPPIRAAATFEGIDL